MFKLLYTIILRNFYTQDGIPGACGIVHQDSDLIAALPPPYYDDGANCFREVKVTRVSTGKSVTVTVADECFDCENNESLDLSIGAFTRLAPESLGEFTSASLSLKKADL